MEKIILKLKELKNDFTIENLDKIIDELEIQLKEKEFKSNPSDKKQLNAIKRMLKHTCKDVLKSYTPVNIDNTIHTVITDGYQLYLLNKEALPLDVAFTKEFFDNKYLCDEYVEKYSNIFKNTLPNIYPDTLGCIPQITPVDYIKTTVSDVLRLYKTTPKEKIIYTFEDKITLNLEYLKNCIDILKLDDKITLELYGENRPVIIHNKDNEVGLIMPVKKI